MLRTYRSTKKVDIAVNMQFHWLNFREMFRDYCGSQMFKEWKNKRVYQDLEAAQRNRDNIKEAGRMYIALSTKESLLDKETLQYDLLSARQLFEIDRKHYYFLEKVR